MEIVGLHQQPAEAFRFVVAGLQLRQPLVSVHSSTGYTLAQVLQRLAAVKQQQETAQPEKAELVLAAGLVLFGEVRVVVAPVALAPAPTVRGKRIVEV